MLYHLLLLFLIKCFNTNNNFVITSLPKQSDHFVPY